MKRAEQAVKAVKADGTEVVYKDKPGFCKVAALEEVREKDYNLTPASYVGVVPMEEDKEPFDVKMEKLTQNLFRIMKESRDIDEEIIASLGSMGWDRW